MSDLFSNICKHCEDPEATHVNSEHGFCFIMSCNCPGYERDNLRYLEECYDSRSSL